MLAIALACTTAQVVEVHGIVDTGTPPVTVDSGEPWTQTPSTPDSGTPPVFEPALDAITPTYGSNLGGGSLTLIGTFDPHTVIEVDGVEADVLDATSSEVTVRIPGSTRTGWVDVTARSGDHAATLPDAFQYWEDGTGRTGLWGWVAYLQMVGDYWVSSDDLAYAALGFTEPLDWSLQDAYSPTLDTCVLGDGGYASPVFYETGASAVTLTAGSRTIALVPEPLAPGSFSGDVLEPVGQVLPGATYDLDPVVGSPNWPGFDVPQAVTVPLPFVVTKPAMAAADPPLVAKNALTFEWGGASQDLAVLYLTRMIDGTTPDVSVTCAMTDDGSFTVPGSVWPEWTAGDFLFVQLGRVNASSGVLPHNNAENSLVGMYWVMGAVETK